MIPWKKINYYGYEKKYVNQVMQSTWLSHGKFIDELEKKICKFTKSKFAVSTSNGTSAIHLAYLAMGLTKDDEIIIPGYGYLAAANIAVQMGLKPVFADVDSQTFCVTAEEIKKKITPKTKLIVVIHTYGNMCNLNPIIYVAKKKGIVVLEDSAESFGSKYRGKQSGSIADIGTFSFQSTKTVTSGEGGMVITKKKRNFRERLRAYRNHGVKSIKYYHHLAGHNFRLPNLQAAIACAQLKRFSKIIKERKRVYSHYKKLFDNIEGITPQLFMPNVDPVIWTFAVILDPKIFLERDQIIKKMTQKGIETRNGFYSPGRLPMYKRFKTSHLKNSNSLSKNVICLPFFTDLKNRQIDYIFKTLLKFRK
tara:strand:+ start:414 stop:1508 length:1095 start_codon:yes stop_codon:yes gene_type:complete